MSKIDTNVITGVAVLRNKLYAFGGYNGSERLSNVEVFNPIKKQWSFVSSMHCKRRFVCYYSYTGYHQRSINLIHRLVKSSFYQQKLLNNVEYFALNMLTEHSGCHATVIIIIIRVQLPFPNNCYGVLLDE